MDMTPYPDYVWSFVDEYKALVEHLGPEPDYKHLRDMLVRECEWSERGSTTLVRLARQYGTFVLANALALAEALEIEDGDAGL
jgi:hypothetical protein